MQINRINFYNFKTQNQNLKKANTEVLKQEEAKETTNLNFMGRTYLGELTTPQFKNNSAKKIFEKIQQYVEIIPENSKTLKPIKVILDGGKSVAFTVDKTTSKITKIIMRDKIDSAESWNSPVRGQDVIHMSLNSKGQMIRGEFIENNFDNCGFRLDFERTLKNNRNIIRNNVEYRPCGKDQNLWCAVDRYQERKQGYSSIEARAGEDRYFDEIFFEMAKLYTTINKQKNLG